MSEVAKDETPKYWPFHHVISFFTKLFSRVNFSEIKTKFSFGWSKKIHSPLNVLMEDGTAYIKFRRFWGEAPSEWTVWRSNPLSPADMLNMPMVVIFAIAASIVGAKGGWVTAYSFEFTVILQLALLIALAGNVLEQIVRSDEKSEGLRYINAIETFMIFLSLFVFQFAIYFSSFKMNQANTHFGVNLESMLMANMTWFIPNLLMTFYLFVKPIILALHEKPVAQRFARAKVQHQVRKSNATTIHTQEVNPVGDLEATQTAGILAVTGG